MLTVSSSGEKGYTTSIDVNDMDTLPTGSVCHLMSPLHSCMGRLRRCVPSEEPMEGAQPCKDKRWPN
jgi:hypothetical protein